MRNMRLDLCALSRGSISRALFGAMFRKVIDLNESDHRQLGAPGAPLVAAVDFDG